MSDDCQREARLVLILLSVLTALGFATVYVRYC
jgi:hypothetical protein